MFLVTWNCVLAENTECSGTSKVASQGSFTLGYNYSFTTNNIGDVTFTCELLDNFTNAKAYAWTYNPNFAEVGMTASGNKFSKIFTGQLYGTILTGLTPGIKYFVRAYATNNAGTNYGPEITFTAPDTEIPKAFTAKSGTPLSTSIPLYLNATDNSGSVTYTISYGSKPTIVTVGGTSGTESVCLIENLTIDTEYSFSITVKDATGNVAANSPIIITTKTKPGVTSAPIPTFDPNNVVSVFSDTYNSIGGTLFNPLGAQNTLVSIVQVSGNSTLKYSYFDYEETELGSDLDLTTLGMTNLHIDAWSEDETLLKVTLFNRSPSSEMSYTIPAVGKESWNTYDILLSKFVNQSEFSTNSIYKLKIEGSGNSGSGLIISSSGDILLL